ncbi:Ldh family oxidoreductase [Microvirga subterranea]|uniref:LDH2 family malate/lactate/ureidoglycolate dehydrogenase n=1 Tax=Microvirga subterranea TaxID=186651 RepID=A0A370HLX5_9HYPH|nr:Ldh family oxidoreductase [Microvirga subterranea]RDI59583.1 LDH2 family malate/lactate/ureidoglycolate dehydrogenase [Microvirga subterranea]
MSALEAALPLSSPVSSEGIRAFIERALCKVGLPHQDAAKVAELMTEADLTGADAHGIFRLPQYVQRIQTGGINAKPAIKVERTAPATALVDGNNGMGHLVMSRAAEAAIEIARETGVAWVGAQHSNHAGPAALYATMPVEHGMIGLYSAVASANHMAIWGGVEAMLGTNPLAVGIPAGDEPPVILDIATTMVSYGTIKNYALQGKSIPEGWMINKADGKPLTDPKRSNEGLLLPIGGYKGSGLALILGLLAGTLNGAAFGRDVVDFNADATTETNTGHFIVALDVSRFARLETFKAEVDRHLRDLRNSRKLPGFDEIRIPGEQRVGRYESRLRGGIPLSSALRRKLDDLAEELGITPLEA